MPHRRYFIKAGFALKEAFRTLRYRNFRLFFAGQGISLVGTWMQQVAMGWLVYSMTNSAFMLGVISFAGQIPSFVLSPLAGVMADRWDRHRTMVVTQSLSMLQAMVLAYLVLSGSVEVWHLIVLNIFLGAVNSLDIPARQSFIVDMVEKKENLSNAIALNSLMFNSARLAGPSLAGIIIAISGEGVCFLLNGISFIAVILSLLAMKLRGHKAATADRRVFEGLKEGFDYAFNFLPIRVILILLSVTSVFGTSYVMLMPVFARDVLKGGPGIFGLLVASAGAGALFATAYLAFRKSVVGLGRMIPIFCVISALGVIGFALSPYLWLSMLLLGFVGFGFMAMTASSNTILQTIVEDDLRGRVMSLYVMAFMGMTPFGSLLVGYMASLIGARYTVMAGGALCIVVSVWFARMLPDLRSMIHPIYRRLGIIKEVATGIGVASMLSAPPED